MRVRVHARPYPHYVISEKMEEDPVIRHDGKLRKSAESIAAARETTLSRIAIQNHLPFRYPRNESLITRIYERVKYIGSSVV